MSDIPSGPAGEAADGASPVTDDEWEAFQREAEKSVRRPSQAGPAPKEPSARARMVAARLREQDEAAARAQGKWRRGRKNQFPEPARPDGWRTGPTGPERWGGRGGRWDRSRRVGMVFAVLCLLVGALWFADHRGHLNLGGAEAADEVTPLPAETARPTGAPPTALRTDRPTLQRPWAGSPARRWGEGADAIRLPEAEATGEVPASGVADALQATKEFLVAANLDRDVLHGAEPEEALKLLDPLNDAFLDRLREGLRRPTEDNDGSVLFTRFDGDEVRLVGDAVKVRGRTTVEPGDEGRALVEADYTFVYALRHADGGPEVTRVLVRRAITVEVAPPGFRATPGTLWITGSKTETAGVTCAWEPDGLIHPGFPTDGDQEGPDGPTADPYDRSRDVASGDAGTCGTASRV